MTLSVLIICTFCCNMNWRRHNGLGSISLSLKLFQNIYGLDDVIKLKHFPHYWPFVRGIYRSPVDSPHKGQWRGALTFFFICAWTNGWANNQDFSDLRHNCAHYGDIVMQFAVAHTYTNKHETRYQWLGANCVDSCICTGVTTVLFKSSHENKHNTNSYNTLWHGLSLEKWQNRFILPPVFKTQIQFRSYTEN